MNNKNRRCITRREFYGNLSSVMVFVSVLFLEEFPEKLAEVNVLGKVAIWLAVFGAIGLTVNYVVRLMTVAKE